MDFESQLRTLLNSTCQENASNTPDFVLAEYLFACLNAFNKAVDRREQYYGRPAAFDITPANAAGVQP